MAQDKTFNTVCQIINAGSTKDDDLNETLKTFWEVIISNRSPETLSRYHYIQSRHKQIHCKTPMEGHETEHTNKLYIVYRERIQNSSTNTINNFSTNSNMDS